MAPDNTHPMTTTTTATTCAKANPQQLDFFHDDVTARDLPDVQWWWWW